MSGIPGKYVEADIDNIGDGQLREDVENMVRSAMKKLNEYEVKTGDMGGKVTANLSLTISRSKDSDEFMAINWKVNTKEPAASASKLMRAGNGRLLLEANGREDINNKNQGVLVTFDRFGNPKAKINQGTGELLDDDVAEGDDPAGQIRAG